MLTAERARGVHTRVSLLPPTSISPPTSLSLVSLRSSSSLLLVLVNLNNSLLDIRTLINLDNNQVAWDGDGI